MIGLFWTWKGLIYSVITLFESVINNYNILHLQIQFIVGPYQIHFNTSTEGPAGTSCDDGWIENYGWGTLQKLCSSVVGSKGKVVYA